MIMFDHLEKNRSEKTDKQEEDSIKELSDEVESLIADFTEMLSKGKEKE